VAARHHEAVLTDRGRSCGIFISRESMCLLRNLLFWMGAMAAFWKWLQVYGLRTLAGIITFASVSGLLLSRNTAAVVAGCIWLIVAAALFVWNCVGARPVKDSARKDDSDTGCSRKQEAEEEDVQEEHLEEERPPLAVLVADEARDVLTGAVRRSRAAVLASAPDPVQVDQDRQRRKTRGPKTISLTRAGASTAHGMRAVGGRRTQGAHVKPHAGKKAGTGETAGRTAIKFGFTGPKPSAPARAMPRQDPAKTPSENAAVRMMYRGRTLPQPSSARRGLVRGMMRDFPFRPARGMVLVSGYGR
jgi:hypothetical protein